jgi:hypothetical protein
MAKLHGGMVCLEQITGSKYLPVQESSLEKPCSQQFNETQFM